MPSDKASPVLCVVNLSLFSLFEIRLQGPKEMVDYLLILSSPSCLSPKIEKGENAED